MSVLKICIAVNKEKALKTLSFQGFFWSKCGGSNSGPHGPEPCALPAALHLDFGKILSFLQVVKSVVKVKFCEKYERGTVRKSQPVQGISGF